MANRDEEIRVRVTAGEKAKFNEYIEESGEFTGFSDFLRTSAYREMADAGDTQIDTDELVAAFESSVRGVARNIDELQRDMAVVKDKLMDSDGVQQLAAQLYDSLPILDDPAEFERVIPKDRVRRGEGDIDYVTERDTADTLGKARTISDARAWSEYLDESMERTQRALSYCVSQYPDVGVVEYEQVYSPELDRDTEIVKRYYRKEM